MEAQSHVLTKIVLAREDNKSTIIRRSFTIYKFLAVKELGNHLPHKRTGKMAPGIEGWGEPDGC